MHGIGPINNEQNCLLLLDYKLTLPKYHINNITFVVRELDMI
jgi:hypothetical protein